MNWISVNDRMPGHRAMYITCDEFNVVEATMFDGNEDAVWNTVAGTKVTHWMPLPEPPEVKDGNIGQTSRESSRTGRG